MFRKSLLTLSLAVFLGLSVHAAVTVDGVISEAEYQVATTQTQTTSFGDTGLQTLLIADDGTNFYLGIECFMSTTNNRAILIYLDSDGRTGAGTNVVPAAGSGFFNYGNIAGATLDFTSGTPDIDMALNFNNGSSAVVYLDALRFGDNLQEYYGNSATRDGALFSGGAGVNGIVAAYQDDSDGLGGTRKGIEVKIPFAYLPGTTSASKIRVTMGMYDGSNGYMSNQALPPLATSAQPGFGPHNWTATGGDFDGSQATAFTQVPVELSSFSME